jgi:glyoxylase-like metal-dependent hydrolase (beta-lactamase superfamily II)
MSSAKSGGIRFVFNQYLIDDGERRILIDTGPAGTLGQTGRLPEALRALGVQPDSIGAIIVTHMHQDHMGGLVAGGRQNFPAAELYVDRRDVLHWTDPSKRAGAPAYLESSFKIAAEMVRLYPKLQAIDGERQISPGVSIVDLTGHTPGHIGVRIEDAGQSLIMVSDMLFPVIHPEATEVGFLFEQDRPAAQAMRARSSRAPPKRRRSLPRPTCPSRASAGSCPIAASSVGCRPTGPTTVERARKFGVAVARRLPLARRNDGTMDCRRLAEVHA